MRSPLGQINLDNYKPLRELVFEVLREAIITGKLRPGERLMEVQLAEELGVSRTPVREAIRKLELEGLVLMIPRRGAYVAEISMKDIADVFEIRAALEGLAAQLAAERCTPEEIENLERSLVQINVSAERGDIHAGIEYDTTFHDQLVAASHNNRLIQMVANLREQVQRFRSTSLAHPGRMKVAWEEHKKIVEAIAQGDGELARQLAHEHIANAEKSLMDAIRESRETK
ncbi:MAG: GntR family transcriptional regulator [Firmicutes bacterium]|nr:GntR family transcriptional regulator [Bacillota bacterium]